MQLVAEARQEDPDLSLNGAVVRIGQRLGVNADVARVVQAAAVDAGQPPGTTTSCAANFKQLTGSRTQRAGRTISSGS
jgi:transposase